MRTYSVIQWVLAFGVAVFYGHLPLCLLNAVAARRVWNTAGD